MAIELVNGYVLLPEPADWSEDLEIKLRWQTEIALAKRGYEDRAGLRPTPQAEMAWQIVRTSPADTAYLEDRIRAALRSGLACAPCHPRPCYVDSVSADGLTLTLEPTQWSWQPGDRVFTRASDTGDGHPVSIVLAVAGNQLTLSLPLPTFTERVWPVVFGRLEVEDTEQENPDVVIVSCRLYVPAWRLPEASVALTMFSGSPIVPRVIAADWGETINRTFTYDAGIEQVGFGPETLEIEQSYVQHGVTLSAVLKTDSAISDAEAFLGAVGGQRGNFWLPTTERAMQIVSGISATQFLIVAQGLENTWSSQPALYLYFSRPGYTSQIGRINTVTGVSDLNEQVELTSALPHPVDDTWDVTRLRLMRLGDDEMLETYEADGLMTIQVNAIEVPLEYFSEAAVTPQPAYLYAFTARLDSTRKWFFTSHSEEVDYGGHTYTPSAISHEEIKRGIDGADEKISITSFYGPGNPLAIFLPFPPSDRLRLIVRRIDLGADDPDDTAAVLFAGFVSSVKMNGRKLTAEVKSPIDFMDRKLPGFILGPHCNAQLYGPGCNLDKDDWGLATTFDSLNVALVYVNDMGGHPVNWFAAGHLVTGAGDTREVRTITASGDTAARYLVLNYALLHAQPGQAVTIYPGCSHMPGADGCGKFNNFANYRGHPLIPEVNPALKSIDTNDGGGKK